MQVRLDRRGNSLLFQGLQQFQGKFWLRGNLAAGECYAAAGIPVVSPVLQDLLHHFLNGHLLSGHDESTGEAVRGAGSAVLAGGAIVLQGTVFAEGSGSRPAGLHTGAAANAFVRINHQLWPNRQRFRVMAPFARHVAPLEKHCGADPRSVFQRKPLDLRYDSFHGFLPFRCRLAHQNRGLSRPGRVPLLRFVPRRNGKFFRHAVLCANIPCSFRLPVQFLSSDFPAQLCRFVKRFDDRNHIHNLVLLDGVFLHGHFPVEDLQDVVHLVDVAGEI